jgi:hypothetical protein
MITLAKHRDSDRNKGVTGETDPAKIKADLEKIQEEENAKLKQLMKERYGEPNK